ncbi:MAG: DUF1579 family protein [Phycisphaeraceae bacterium]|nr:DUF1579 family protein [Phycisphaeraceae bacterium]MBX3367003.1 DUF1579 family protein [Phycisphaeraceae bacterium]
MDLKQLCRVSVALTLIGAGSSVALAQNVDPAKDAKVKANEAASQAKKVAQDAEKSAQAAMEKAKGGEPPEMSAEEAEMMALWSAAKTPGPHHKHMEVMAGEWEGVSRMWMVPGMPPEESPVRTTARMEFDGLFLISHHKGEMMGMPFRGMGTMGYNNTTKEYEGAWMDNMGSMTMWMTGTCSDDGKVFKLVSTFVDFMTGEKTTMKMDTTVIDNDNYKWEMYGPGPDGVEYKMMEIVYKRKK